MKSPTIFLIALLLLACNPSRQFFNSLVDEYLDWYFSTFPVSATWIGVHDHDGQYARRTPEALNDATTQVRQFQVRLSQIDPATLSLQEEIDFHIFQQSLERLLFELTELREFTWNPIEVAQEVGFGILLLASQEFAPVEERLPSLISRLNDVPRVLDEARANLQVASQVHTQTAIRQIQGAINLVSRELYTLLPELETDQEQALRRASASATAALEDFRRWLEEELLPRAERDFRLGPELYYRKLALTLDEDITPEEILSSAWMELAKTQREMFALAWPRYSQAHPAAAPTTHADSLEVIRWALDVIAQDHASRDEVLENVTGTIQELEDYLQRHNIITLDPNQPLEIRLTPEFQRGVAIAGLEAPGPLEKRLKTFYNVSPIPEDWDDEKAESFLREYNTISVKILSIHEALPGHYVQLYYANRHPSILRAVFGSGVMVEGWAHYSEKMMIQAGLGGGDPNYDLVQKKWYLRVIANAIIDQGIHARGMTRQEALNLMENETFQEQSEAELKWVRAQLTSAQLSTYFVGNTLMWQLRSDVETLRGRKFDLREFHEELLSHGSPPIKYLRKLLL
ncbi:MAG: DUF885 domain-containing protein [Candidatus Neomarinimicrobiota bacterium]